MKGIIVVDEISKCCYECNVLTEQCECLAMDVLSVEVDTEKGKPEWCPIRQIPDKVEILKNAKGVAEIQEKAFSIGWNDCIDKILNG